MGRDPKITDGEALIALARAVRDDPVGAVRAAEVEPYLETNATTRTVKNTVARIDESSSAAVRSKKAGTARIYSVDERILERLDDLDVDNAAAWANPT